MVLIAEAPGVFDVELRQQNILLIMKFADQARRIMVLQVTQSSWTSGWCPAVPNLAFRQLINCIGSHNDPIPSGFRGTV